MRLFSAILASVAIGLIGGCKKEIQWHEVAIPGASYTLQFPGKPTEKSEIGPLGVPLTSYEVRKKDRAFEFAYAKLNPSLAYDSSAAIKAIGEKVKASKSTVVDFTMENSTGQAFEMETTEPKGFMVGRIIRIDQELFQLYVIGEKVQLSDPDVQQFFASMKMVEGFVRTKTQVPTGKTRTPATEFQQRTYRLVQEFMKDLAAERYAAAYQKLSTEMQQKETEEEFIARAKGIKAPKTPRETGISSHDVELGPVRNTGNVVVMFPIGMTRFAYRFGVEEKLGETTRISWIDLKWGTSER